MNISPIACNPHPPTPLDILPPGIYTSGMTTELNVTGMSCGHCVRAVEKALKAVPGVENVQVTLEPGKAVVEGNASQQDMIAAVVEEGYQAEVAQA